MSERNFAEQQVDAEVAADVAIGADGVTDGAEEVVNIEREISEETPESEAVAMAETEADEAPEELELTLEEQLEAAREEAAKNLDGWMRAQAEFANARKRMEKQRSETYLNATADVVSRLLPILDDFGRALSDIPDEISEYSWTEGMKLVQKKLMTTVEGYNVKPIEAVGKPFDPKYHEAIMQEPSDEYESGFVTKELQQGYQMGDRVIRPSLVYVAE